MLLAIYFKYIKKLNNLSNSEKFIVQISSFVIAIFTFFCIPILRDKIYTFNYSAKSVAMRKGITFDDTFYVNKNVKELDKNLGRYNKPEYFAVMIPFYSKRSFELENFSLDYRLEVAGFSAGGFCFPSNTIFNGIVDSSQNVYDPISADIEGNPSLKLPAGIYEAFWVWNVDTQRIIDSNERQSCIEKLLKLTNLQMNINIYYKNLHTKNSNPELISTLHGKNK